MPRRTNQMELPMPQEPELQVSTLRPGYLVMLATSVRGNVQLHKEIIEPEHRLRSGAIQTTVQIQRTINDPEEHKKANQARMKARAIISSVCAKSAFGLLCPQSNFEKLKVAQKEAQRVVDRFNRTSSLSRVEVYTITGRVEQSDVQAVRAIKSEVREMLKEMTDGVKNVNVKKIREAAVKARSIGTMLSPDASEALKSAVDAARGAARKIVKAGEDAVQEVDRQAINAINAARTSFLDTDENEAPAAETTEAAATETRAVDVDPEAVEAPTATMTGRVRAERPARSNKPKKGTVKKHSLPPTHPAIRGASKAVKKANKALRERERAEASA